MPAASSTSACTIRPRGPLPLSRSSATPCTRAARRASGVASGARGPAPLLGAAAAPSALGDAARSASGERGAPTRAIGTPTATVSPSATTISSVPSTSLAYVMLALSVSISTSSSPRATFAPSAISQRRIVPSSIESDRRGIAISRAVVPAAACSLIARLRQSRLSSSISSHRPIRSSAAPTIVSASMPKWR